MVFSNINEAWVFLVSYSHNKYTVGHLTYFEWYFYDKDENMYKLQHEVGTVKKYTINNWFLFKNCKETYMIENIVSLINQYKKDIEKNDEYLNKNQLLMDSLNDKLGKCTNYIDNGAVWIFELKNNVKMKIKVLMYNENISLYRLRNKKQWEETKVDEAHLLKYYDNQNISLYRLRNKEEWEETKVNETQLLDFLKENKNKIIITSKKCDEDLITKIEKLSLKRNVESIEDVERELVSKFSKVKLYHDTGVSEKYSKLFIQIDRKKRYEIQACKKF
jgi:hypothetical protein